MSDLDLKTGETSSSVTPYFMPANDDALAISTPIDDDFTWYDKSKRRFRRITNGPVTWQMLLEIMHVRCQSMLDLTLDGNIYLVSVLGNTMSFK